MKITEISTNIWSQICNTKEEAEQMKLKSFVLSHLEQDIRNSDKTQEVIAGETKLHRNTINDLACGRISRFSLDRLVAIATAFGYSISLTLSLSNE